MTDSAPLHRGVVKFMPPNSCRVELSFFEKLYELKLNDMKLDVDDFPISAYLRNHEMVLTAESLKSAADKSDGGGDKDGVNSHVYSCGVLKNVNTANEFISLDKPALLTATAAPLWALIRSGEVVHMPNRLLDFAFLSFADLKQYRFTYWLGFPAFVASIPYRHERLPQLLRVPNTAPVPAKQEHETETEYVEVTLRDSGASSSSTASPALSASTLHQVHIWSQRHDSQGVFALMRDSDSSNAPGEYGVCTLAEAWRAQREGSPEELDVVYCVKDVHGAFSSPPGQEQGGQADYTPGWGVRNVLAFLAHSLSAEEDRVVRVLCVQQQPLPSDSRSSENRQGCYPLLTIVMPKGCLRPVAAVKEKPEGVDEIERESDATSVMPRVVGWQANERGKPGPRVLDAAIVMDTRRIMEQAVDLNVRLMKWRLWPSLDTEMLASTKCLLLGAGTLGCAVARTLMGWGVRDITLVDNGRVSYSNPARQSLFEFKDCEEKAFKSEAAARRLQAIFPGMRARGLVITIPMPGHRAASEEERAFLRTETRKLDQLVQEHDVVFALTDSREARWLPTVQCAVHDKLLINSALGFDSYLVMRHGHGGQEVVSEDSTSEGDSSSDRLGCYFCMDVIGPGNSQRDRTLDQQCTVTRPGLAQIASGLAVELMVALLHSPRQQRTPALAPLNDVANAVGRKEGEEVEEQEREVEEEVTLLPHQIRGVLGSFSQVNPVCSSFKHCTACSPAILRRYCVHPDDSSGSREEAAEAFVEEVCNDPGGLLESLSGVSGLIAGLDDLDLDMSDEDEDEHDMA